MHGSQVEKAKVVILFNNFLHVLILCGAGWEEAHVCHGDHLGVGSFYHVEYGDETQIASHGVEHLYLVSHHAAPWKGWV